MLCNFAAILIILSFPTPYTFFIDTVGTAVSLTAISFIFTFYVASVPDLHRNCIQGLSRLLMVCLSLVIIRSYLISLMVNVFKEVTQSFITNYPEISCCLVNDKVTLGPLVLSLLMLLISRV